jgi:plasmid stabilization system protein ParE
MTLQVNWSPTAAQDRTGLIRFLRERGSEAALRFIDATEQACQRLADFPYIAPVWESANPRLAGIRVWPVPGFTNHLLFYRVTDKSVRKK